MALYYTGGLKTRNLPLRSLLLIPEEAWDDSGISPGLRPSRSSRRPMDQEKNSIR